MWPGKVRYRWTQLVVLSAAIYRLRWWSHWECPKDVVLLPNKNFGDLILTFDLNWGGNDIHRWVCLDEDSSKIYTLSQKASGTSWVFLVRLSQTNDILILKLRLRLRLRQMKFLSIRLRQEKQNNKSKTKTKTKSKGPWRQPMYSQYQGTLESE